MLPQYIVTNKWPDIIRRHIGRDEKKTVGKSAKRSDRRKCHVIHQLIDENVLLFHIMSVSFM